MSEEEPTRVIDHREALDRVNDGVVALDGEFRCTYVNDRAATIFGTPKAALVDRIVWDAFPDVTGTAAETNLREAREKNEKRRFERYNDELERWYEARIYPTDDGLTVYLTDISERKGYKEDLTRTSRQLAALVENTSEAVYIKDHEGRYELMNAAGAALFDCESAEVLGLTDDDLFDAESADAITEVDERILATGESTTRESTRFIDGERHVFLDNKYPYYDEDGAIRGIMGISREVTERQSFEERLRTLQKTIRELTVARSRSAIASLAVEATIEILELPVSALWLYDDEQDALVPVAESDGARETLGPAPTFERGEGLLWTVFETGEYVAFDDVSGHPEVYNEETPLGSEILVPLGDRGVISTSSTESGVFDESDEDLFRILAAATREALGRADREAEFRELTEEYEALLENAEDAIFLIDVDHGEEGPEFRYERLSPSHEEVSGMTNETVAGKTPTEALDEVNGEAVAANYHRCVEAGEPISYEEQIEMPEGTLTWHTNLAPVVVDGVVTRIVGIARDVTDRVTREQELRRKNERLDEFAGVISHDLRNPLNVAQGRTTLLAEESESEHVAPLKRALARMESIVEDTLTLAREGSSVAETEQCLLSDVVGRCWGMVETQDASLEIPDRFAVRADPERLSHVFENLFRNAVEHSSPSPPSNAREDGDEHGSRSVTVEVGRLADGFYVEDDGPGIPPERRDSVFEPGETTAVDGTGFGLAIVRRIAEAHGWQVRVTDATGGGARFEFTGVDVVG